ncbi:MAG TPA: polyprenol monophosphomannose synthase [Myxococcales bacterium]|nr:polyprenol monophosphomannose synthase [Myxococcales bacterium]
MRDALVVLPTYNEAENLPAITRAILDASDRIEILVVDDNSPDGTGRLADDLATAEPRIHVLHRERKEGLGRAYLAGFGWALAHDYAFILEMDADFSHDPHHLPELLDAAGHADLVLGSRYVEGGGTQHWGVLRRFVSQGGSLYARTVLGVNVRDLTGGFKCFRRQTLERLDLETVRSEGYSFQIELTYRAISLGLRVVEVPIVFADRRVGKSKMSRRIFFEAAGMVLRLRLDRRAFLRRTRGT